MFAVRSDGNVLIPGKHGCASRATGDSPRAIRRIPTPRGRFRGSRLAAVLRRLVPGLPLAAALASLAAPPAGAVVGGRDVVAGDYPWLVGSRGCTGALIAPDRVVTAAHCVRGHLPQREQ